MKNENNFGSLAKDWEAHGHVDPFFGVLSDPEKRGGKWDAAAFFESGHHHVANLMAALRDGGRAVAPEACLDFGCGVGRLTQPLCEYFDRVVGVDVARSMVRQARRYNRHGARCRYVVNRTPNLRQFGDASFTFVHSCIVLQHLPPELSKVYIGEFFRVCRPGGLVVFQLPVALRPAEMSAAAFALPAGGYAAEISQAGPLPVFHAGESAVVPLRVRNLGSVVWRHDLPTPNAGRIRVGNHWLASDGTVVIRDDGRAELPATVPPGETAHLLLTVRAPGQPGVYTLECDVVQELVSWFADKGSQVFQVAVDVTGSGRQVGSDLGARALGTPRHSAPLPVQRAKPRSGFLAALFGRRRDVKPTFPMHVVPRADVERVVTEHDGEVLRVYEDEACGAGWVSYTYICRRAL